MLYDFTFNSAGNAGDALEKHNYMKFTTKDRDKDDVNYNCAVMYSGGWWYNSCHDANLNGVYFEPGDHSNRGIFWRSWKGFETRKKLR